MFEDDSYVAAARCLARLVFILVGVIVMAALATASWLI